MLIVLAVAVRVPLVRYYDFVTYDGTYYINQAKALLHGALAGGSFPIGYPLVIAPILAVARDGVLAAALVSFLAGIGSVLLLYELARTRFNRIDAALGAAVLAVTPLFIQVSLVTLSESVYVFWVLLALVLFGRERFAAAGLAMGMAAATRPEALGVAGVLGAILAWRWVRGRRVAPRSVLAFAAGFAVLYAVSVTAMSIPEGHLAVLSRSGAYGSKATPWMLRETALDFEGKQKAEAQIREKWQPLDRAREYATRVPTDAGRVAWHLLPAIPLLALAGVRRRRDYVLAAFAPMLVIPLFTEDRGALRWMAPYVPPLIYYAIAGIDGVGRKRLADIARTAVVVCAMLALVVHRDVLRSGIEDAMRPVRDVARTFAPKVSPGDRIADRKPYFPFYAGGQYVEIPIAPYDEAIAWLAKNDVRYLSLFQPSIHNLRPAMRPLVYDLAAIRGELRYQQVLFDRTGEIVYQRALETDPLTERPLTSHAMADLAPAWSPDGAWIAFRRNLQDGTSTICLTDAAGDSVRTILDVARVADFLSWSADSRRIAFSNVVDNNQDIYTVDIRTHAVTRITRDPARDYAPSWCAATGEIVFGSDRGGTPGVYAQTGPGGAATRISSKGVAAGPPGVSSSGKFVAWSDAVGRLVLSDRRAGREATLAAPTGILSAPAWSPNEDVVAVGAYDWGSADIYLIRVADGRSLRLTRQLTGKSMPCWSPDGQHLAVVSGEHNDVAITVLGNLAPYLGRLDEADDVSAFKRPPDTRSAPPAP